MRNSLGNRLASFIIPFLAVILLALGAAADAIFAVSRDGQMFYYRYAGAADGSSRWPVEQARIGSGWGEFKHVFAGDGGAIYGILPDGQMLFYRYAGLADGAFRWAVEQKLIGTGWNGFQHVFAGDNGAIYGVLSDGRTLFYRHAGMADGSNR